MRRRPGLILALLVVVGSAACGDAPADVRSDVCSDLSNLRATVEGLASPNEDARVGTVRGDLEKLDPTFGNVSRSGLVPEDVLQPMLQAHVGYRDLIGHLSDDDPYLTVPAQARIEAVRLLESYRTVVVSLGCSRI